MQYVAGVEAALWKQCPFLFTMFLRNSDMQLVAFVEVVDHCYEGLLN